MSAFLPVPTLGLLFLLLGKENVAVKVAIDPPPLAALRLEVGQILQHHLTRSNSVISEAVPPSTEMALWTKKVRDDVLPGCNC